jgi:hypothetical protein
VRVQKTSQRLGLGLGGLITESGLGFMSWKGSGGSFIEIAKVKRVAKETKNNTPYIIVFKINKIPLKN